MSNLVNDTTFESKEKDNEHLYDPHFMPNKVNFINSDQFLPDGVISNSRMTHNTNNQATKEGYKIKNVKDLEFGFIRDSEDLFIVLNAKNQNKEKLQSIYQTNVNQF